MPSLIIACLSQKGGVGKSTLARLIARTYAAAGWSVKIADFNTKQKTSVDWVALRLNEQVEPTIAAESFAAVKPALRQDYDLFVFDGKPDADTTTLDCAKAANLVVIPVGTAIDDLKPQVLFAHELRARGIQAVRILFILNKTMESDVAIGDARTYITSAGYNVAKGELPMKVGYQMAQNSGRAVSETVFQTLNDRAEVLAGEIVVAATRQEQAA